MRCAERPENRPAQYREHRRGQGQGREQGDRERQRDRRPGELDLGEARKIEHPQPDDHRAGAGDQSRSDLADRFAERIGLALPRFSSSQ